MSKAPDPEKYNRNVIVILVVFMIVAAVISGF